MKSVLVCKQIIVVLNQILLSYADFQKKGFAVDARLAHAAIGIELGLGRLGAENSKI